MVEILCPHCEEEIPLDDDASGEFICPYCEGKFEWNINPIDNHQNGETHVTLNVTGGLFSGSLLITGLALLLGSYVGFQLSSILLAAASDGSDLAVMGIAGVGYLLSLFLGVLGLSFLVIGIRRLTGS